MRKEKKAKESILSSHPTYALKLFPPQNYRDMKRNNALNRIQNPISNDIYATVFKTITVKDHRVQEQCISISMPQ